MTRRVPSSLAVSLLVAAGLFGPATAAGAAADWTWPVVGPVIRAVDPPDSPYGSGHRGIDIAAVEGTVVVAPAAGTVTFAGPVGGRLFLTLAHAGGLSSTYSWISEVLVRKGDQVARGQPVARTGTGHPGDLVPSLHLGVKLDGAYVDPLAYLGPLDLSSLIRLAPI